MTMQTTNLRLQRGRRSVAALLVVAEANAQNQVLTGRYIFLFC